MDRISDSVPHGRDENNDQDHLVCPNCGSRLVRRSMRRTIGDRLKSLFGKWPYRCQMCDTRFNGQQDPAFVARRLLAREREAALWKAPGEAEEPKQKPAD